MHRAAFLCLLAGGCCIAFAPIFVRLSDTGPVASAFWRTALATPLLWLWLLRTNGARDDFPSRGKSSLAPFVPLLLAGIFFALDLGVWHWSIVWTSVANS